MTHRSSNLNHIGWAQVRATNPPEVLNPTTQATERFRCYNPIDRQTRGLAGASSLDRFEAIGLLEEASEALAAK